MKKDVLQRMVLDSMFQPRYSGEASARIWNVVNRSGDRTLYDFSCALQDLESRFLAIVNSHVEREVRAVVRRKGKAR